MAALRWIYGSTELRIYGGLRFGFADYETTSQQDNECYASASLTTDNRHETKGTLDL